MRLGAGELRNLLERHGIEPSRALGQNFVADPNTIDRIVRLAGVAPGDRVVEIGPGVGSLTIGLAAGAAEVVAVELDRHLEVPFREVVERAGVADRVRLVHADATTVDWSRVLDDGDAGSWKLVANLPYNVSTTVVLRLLDEAPMVTEMLVMVQREVGERLAAEPGNGDYGIPSVKVAYWATAEVVGRVPASVFVPVPRVESVLVRVRRRSEPATEADPDLLFTLVRTAFGQRRKMLRRSLAGRVTTEQWAEAAIDPSTRPEQLSVHDWGRLARAVAEG